MLERARFRDDSGSAAVEFVLVGALLTTLTLSVLQLGLALLIRNTVLDAAGEGARWAALADNQLGDGIERARALVMQSVGERYAHDVTASYGEYLGHPATIVTIRTPLPIFGLLGIDKGLEVQGHAAVETVDR